ncbi:MerR family transcriptional regulator [Nocardia ninae]|uniref:MerR family transcriptional regulator n=1 Tax=Nocardia ninae NBRC 108245 TaxID=1210091 RepID=A0A511M4G9_9NOCA|nr:MerR family transcriptional regulator [Nocardia ninae]GEM35544.1 MerR family transcriptional regulator [Nocardia ninae NBRC 108245]
MDKPGNGQVWKVGELATEIGLTVRTLHHYDRIGLVSPAGRTNTGHRLYTEADVERLYQVVALRQLGLGLDQIANVLAGTTAITQVLAVHRDFLAAQVCATQALHALVAALAATAQNRPDICAHRFLELIRRTVMVDDTVKQYFTQEQLAQLAHRREQSGEPHIEQVEAGWGELISQVDAAIEAGLDPASPQAHQLAARWMRLLEEFHGGDPGLRDSLYRMQADNAERIQNEFRGPSPAQIEFIQAANASRGQ